jgi:hypothetical protein
MAKRAFEADGFLISKDVLRIESPRIKVQRCKLETAE